jgi:hypothetical protein
MFELGECFAHGKGVSFVSAPPRAVARDLTSRKRARASTHRWCCTEGMNAQVTMHARGVLTCDFERFCGGR